MSEFSKKDLKFRLNKTLTHQDLDLLQIALSDDGRVSQNEKEVLLKEGIPEILLKALQDGVIDDKEMKELVSFGIPKNILLALRDGQLPDEEIDLLKVQITEKINLWERRKLAQLLMQLEEASEKNP